LKSLAEAAVGDRGKVIQIEGTDGISIRLLEMGLTPGTRFTLLGVAPLGDPLELEVRGYHLSLRKSEAARIRIETVGAAAE
jgi:Fe2+ transport system protein FeoA